MRRIPFTTGWQTRPHANSFAEMAGAAAPWQDVALPHDATLGEPRDGAHGAGRGYLPGGVYEYRRTFDLPADAAGQRWVLEFEDVYRRASVHVNGALAGHWASGYTGSGWR